MTAQVGTATGAAALTYAELLNHDEQETGQWHEWFRAHPEVLLISGQHLLIIGDNRINRV